MYRGQKISMEARRYQSDVLPLWAQLYVEALDALLRGRMAEVAVARDWELLREIARLAQQDAPQDLATTDPALFST